MLEVIVVVVESSVKEQWWEWFPGRWQGSVLSLCGHSYCCRFCQCCYSVLLFSAVIQCCYSMLVLCTVRSFNSYHAVQLCSYGFASNPFRLEVLFSLAQVSVEIRNCSLEWRLFAMLHMQVEMRYVVDILIFFAKKTGLYLSDDYFPCFPHAAHCTFRYRSWTTACSTCLITISSSLRAVSTSFRNWRLSTDEWLLGRSLPATGRLTASRRCPSTATASSDCSDCELTSFSWCLSLKDSNCPLIH